MPDGTTFTVFLVASLVLLVVPGPAVLYIVARSIDHGVGAGIVSALGIAIGTVGLVLAAAFGVAALIEASPLAFTLIRYAGGAYLMYLGVRTFRARESGGMTAIRPAASSRRIFTEGIVVNFLNPKTAIFFLAFLPQFVDPSGSIRFQMIVLGMIFVGLGVVTDSAYALAAGALAKRLRTDRRFPAVRRVLVSAIYILLGVLAATFHPTI
jgi:threonine/homoserine/homoserine lactone efflux protein